MNFVLATNTKQSTMRAAMGKVNSIPARPNTTIEISDISGALGSDQVTQNFQHTLTFWFA